MAIDLRKESYDENGVRKPLTVCPDVESPEIYPQRKAGSAPAPLTVYPVHDETFPQNKSGSVPVKSPSVSNDGNVLSVRRAGKIKKGLVIGGCSVLLFTLFILAGLNFAQDRDGSETGSEGRFTSGGIETVSVASAGNTLVEFAYDTEGSENIVVKTSDNQYFTSSLTDSCLSLSCGGFKKNTAVTVLLPVGYDGKIMVEGEENCDIEVNAGNDIDISIFSGKINAAGLKAVSSAFSVTDGNVDITGSEFSELSIKVGTGKASVCDSHISDSFYTYVIKGRFDARRVVSEGTSEIIAAGGHLASEKKEGGDIYCEDIRLSGKARLFGYDSVKLYRADFGDMEMECVNTLEVHATQPADIYKAYCNKKDLKYYPSGSYELNVTIIEEEVKPLFEFDCDPPAAPAINN